MKNIIKSELYKLVKSRAFWISLLVCAFVAVVMPLAAQQGVKSGEPEFKDLSLSAVEILCYSFKLPIFTLIAAVFVSVFVSGEFHYGTMKNYVSKGFLREGLFLSKYLASAAAVTVMYLVYIPVALSAGTVFLGFDPYGVFQIGTFGGMFLGTWLLLMAYSAVFTAIGMTLRTGGAAIATNICLVSIVPTLLSALDFLFSSFGIKVSRIWIGEHMASVATMAPVKGTMLIGIVVGLSWLAAALGGGTFFFKKQDIK